MPNCLSLMTPKSFMSMLWVAIMFSTLIGASERVRLRDISSLTFHHGTYTTSRHGRSIPELKCVGGSALKSAKYHPLSVQCYNRGFDGQDVQWECKAQLNKKTRFGKITVNCEGYDYPKDEYVVAGSCGLEYNLHYVDSHRMDELKSNFKSVLGFEWLSVSPYLPLIGLLCVGLLIWYCCLGQAYDQVPSNTPRSFSYDAGATPVPPSAPYPAEDPPNYEEATRGRFASEDYTFRQRSVPSQEYGFPTFHPDPPRTSGYSRPKVQTGSGSWLSNGLSAGAGFLGGYFFGSRDRDQHRVPPMNTRSNRLYPEFANDYSYDLNRAAPRGDRSRSSSRESSHVATGFAKTSRR